MKFEPVMLDINANVIATLDTISKLLGKAGVSNDMANKILSQVTDLANTTRMFVTQNVLGNTFSDIDTLYVLEYTYNGGYSYCWDEVFASEENADVYMAMKAQILQPRATNIQYRVRPVNVARVGRIDVPKEGGND